MVIESKVKRSKSSDAPTDAAREPRFPSPDTVERILEGALRALGRRGLRKLSMSDVCEEVGVSRGTLYRYFKSKQEILDAIGNHVEAEFRADLDAATDGQPDPSERVHAALGAIMRFGEQHPEALQVINAEPAFALAYLRSRFPGLVEMVRTAIAGSSEEQVSDQRDVAEVCVRLGLSALFVPDDGGDGLVRVARASGVRLPTAD
jgi:AcrR family transcriptional regulator